MKMFDDEEDDTPTKINEKTNDLNNKLNLLLNDKADSGSNFNNPIQRSNTVLLPKFQPSSILNKSSEPKATAAGDKPKRTAFFEDDEPLTPKKTVEVIEEKPVEIKPKETPIEVKSEKREVINEPPKRKPIFFDEEDDLSHKNATKPLESPKELPSNIPISEVPKPEPQISELQSESASIIKAPFLDNISKGEEVREKEDDNDSSSVDKHSRSSSMNNAKYSGIQNVKYFIIP
jgi:hypothetical protein